MFTGLLKTFEFTILVIIFFSYLFFYSVLFNSFQFSVKFSTYAYYLLNILNISCISWLYYLGPARIHLHCLFSFLWSHCFIYSSAGWIFTEFQKLYLKKKCQDKVRYKVVFFQRGFVFACNRRLGPLEVLDYLHPNLKIERIWSRTSAVVKIVLFM